MEKNDIDNNVDVGSICQQSKVSRTKKPISTISYNTDEWLSERLNALVDGGILSFWCYINHKPESNEKKFHKHVYMEPARNVNVQSIRDFLSTEIDKSNNKCLGVMPFRNSNFYDWYWYALHDRYYLEMKKPMEKEKQYRYTRSNIVSSDEDYFSELVNTSPLELTDYYKGLTILLEDVNIEYNDFVHLMRGYQSARFYKNYKDGLRLLYDDLKEEVERKLKRQVEKEENESLIDSQTGEVIEEDDLPF